MNLVTKDQAKVLIPIVAVVMVFLICICFFKFPQNSPSRTAFILDYNLYRNQTDQMIAFGKEMQKTLGLSNSDVKKADDMEYSWQLPGYTVSAQDIKVGSSWKTVLFARPSSLTAGNLRYNRAKSSEFLEGWQYSKRLYGVTILPPKDIQEEIKTKLKEI